MGDSGGAVSGGWCAPQQPMTAGGRDVTMHVQPREMQAGRAVQMSWFRDSTPQ